MLVKICVILLKLSGQVFLNKTKFKAVYEWNRFEPRLSNVMFSSYRFDLDYIKFSPFDWIYITYTCVYYLSYLA